MESRGASRVLTRILVPPDGSSSAEQVIPYARGLARRLGSRIDLIQVIEPAKAASGAPGSGRLRSDPNERLKAQAYVNEIAAGIREDNVFAEGFVHDGDPAAYLVSQASRGFATNLVAIATRGRTGIDRVIKGSVSEKILQGSMAPVLIVHTRRAGPPKSEVLFNKIYVPLDGSEASERVLPPVTAMARQLGIGITMLGVADRPSDRFVPESEKSRPSFKEHEYNDTAIGYFQSMVDILQREGISPVDYRLLSGDPAGAILELINGEIPTTEAEEAKMESENLLAIATHGRSGIRNSLAGSVTNRVIRNTRGPIMVVRAR
ncbi:MAG: universal stress protein [SAR202 cluster bacterium]|nr:universal stress protein [SAR202 cluster bacterium]